MTNFITARAFYKCPEIIVFKCSINNLLSVVCTGKKSHVRETLNLSMCADRNTNTKIYQKSPPPKKKFSLVTCRESRVTYHISHVTYHMTPVTCHLSPTQTATFREPSPANSPPMHSSLVCKVRRRKKQKKKM